MSKVVIVLERGLVQFVYSNDRRIQVAVLDYDVFEDIEPKLDLDSFFFTVFDPELTVLKEWQRTKSDFLAEYGQSGEE